jgi:AraC-like DNA-binding protein
MKSGQMYIRLFLVIAILLAIMIVPFSAFVSAQYSRYAYSEVRKLSESKLSQMLENTEFILRKLKDYGLRMYEDPSILNWLSSAAEDGLIQNEARLSMIRLMATEPFISRVYLVNFRTERVMDSLDGLVPLAEFADQNMLDIVRSDRPKFQQYFSHRAGNRNYLAMIYPSNAHLRYSGYLVMLLDTAALQSYLLQFHPRIDVQVAILDADGRVVLGEIDPDLMAVSRDNDSIVRLKSGNAEETWIVNQARMRSQNWTIHDWTRMNEWEQKVEHFQQTIFMTTAGILLVLLSALYLHLKRQIRPFSLLANRLQRQLNLFGEGGDGPAEEIRVLENGIEMLVDRINSFRLSMRDHHSLIKQDLLRQWILSGRLGNPANRLPASDFKLSASNIIILALFRIEGYRQFVEKYGYSSRKLLKYAMGNIAEEVLGQYGWLAEPVDMGGEYLTVLIGHESEKADPPAAEIHEAQKQIERWIKLKTVAAVSEIRQPQDDLRRIYEDLCQLTMLKFVQGEDKVYTERDYERCSPWTVLPNDQEKIDQLIKAVKAGYSDRIVPLLDNMMADMQQLPYRECIFQLTRIVYAIVTSFGHLMEVDGRTIQDMLEQFDTLREARNWLLRELQGIIEKSNADAGPNRKDEIVCEIMEFIHGRLHDASLNVEQIADRVSLSSRYIRQIFKAATGMTIADYILTTRMDNVKRLLRETRLSIAEIAEQSGFLTKSHFYTAFKKAAGMTPNEYRMLHQNP